MTRDELMARLSSLEADPHCWVCGDADWAPHGEAVFVLPKANHGVVLNEGVSCVVMFCRVCGNARFHSTKILERTAV
jgi:hypothetical protein